MNILLFIDSLGSGGAQRQLVELGIGFKESGHNVSYLTYHENDFYKPILLSLNIPIYCIEDKNYINRFLKIRKFIRKNKYDVVLSFLESANLISICSSLPKRNWKILVGERSSNPNILKSYKLIIFRFFHIFADYIIANSFENIKIIKKINPIIPNYKYKVIYNIIDKNKWNPSFNYKLKKNGVFHLVVLSSHRYLKNFNGLIEAVNLLSLKNKQSLKIEWYGDSIISPFFDNSFLEGYSKIQKLGLEYIFSFYPATTNIHNIVKNADAIGLFSLYEGLPNAVCEGMTCGKLILSSAVSDIPLLISDPRCLFDPNNIKEISKTLEWAINIEEKEYNIIVKDNINKSNILFNKNDIIKKYINLFLKNEKR